MKFKAAFLAVVALSASSVLAFQSGDKIVCYDDVSAETYTIKIQDVRDEEAYVRIDSPNGSDRFYPSSRVRFSMHSDGFSVDMIDSRRRIAESIDVDQVVSTRGEGPGVYADRGDSRGIDCVLRK